MRTSAGLTQADIAALVGVSHGTYARWETGATSPDLPSARRLAEVFNTDPMALTTITPETATLAELRAARGFYQDEAAAGTGMSTQTWQSIERGERAPTDAETSKLATMLSVDTETLTAVANRTQDARHRHAEAKLRRGR